MSLRAMWWMGLVACAGAGSPPDDTDAEEVSDTEAPAETGAEDTVLDTEVPLDSDLPDPVPLGSITADEAVAALEAEVVDLLFLSESESPVRVGRVEDAASPFPTERTITGVLAPVWDAPAGSVPLRDRVVQVVQIPDFFDRLTVEAPFWEDFDRAQQPRWLAIRELFESELAPVGVFRLGEDDLGLGRVGGAVEIYVVGGTRDGHLVGIHVRSIET